MSLLARRVALVLLLGLQALLLGCATAGAGGDSRDPWEGYNRKVWRFNEAVDQAVLQPVARGYQAAVPGLVRVGVGNFFGNISDVWSFVNNALQLKPVESVQTLGVWGLPSGPYLVLPLLGPSTVRDTVALPVDRQGDLVSRVQDSPARLGLTGLRVVDLRADVLQAGQVIEGAALDKYTFVRDAYMQRRRGAADLPKTRPEPEERFDLPEQPDPSR